MAGNTPLHVCATWDQDKSATVLLKRGADAMLKNRAGQTAADVAMMASSVKVHPLARGHLAHS